MSDRGSRRSGRGRLGMRLAEIVAWTKDSFVPRLRGALPNTKVEH